MNILNCVYCGTKLKNIIGVQKEYLDGKVIVIDNAPLVMCEHCMEEYIPPDTMDVINKILSYYHSKITDNIDGNPVIRVDYTEFNNNI